MITFFCRSVALLIAKNSRCISLLLVSLYLSSDKNIQHFLSLFC